jgi:hypothetical protein
VVAGWGLFGTYTFYAVTTAGAAGVFGSGLFDSLGIWKNQPSWSPILFVGIALALALLLAALPAKGGTNVLLVVETLTVALILLVVYVLATIGMTRLVFVRRKMPSVPMWQIVIPAAAIVVLGYTLYRNVYPYPSGDAYWFPVVGGAWLVAAIIGVLAAPRTARRLGAALAAREGINAAAPEDVSR